MKIIVKKEAPFQVTGDSIAISPSNEGYELYFSADGLSYTSTGKVVPANTAFQYKAKTEGLFYKLVGNDSDVTVSFIKDCGGGGGGAIHEDAPEDGNIYGRKDGEWAQISASFEAVVVDELPTASEETMGKMYFVPQEETEEGNISLEYVTIRIDDTYQWEQVGSTAVDLSGYYTKEETDTIIEEVESVVAKSLNDLKENKEDKIDYIIFDYNNPVWTQEQLDFINSNPQREEILKRCLIKNGGSYYKVIYADGDNNITCFAQGIALLFGLNWKPKVVGGEQGTYRYNYYRKDEVDNLLNDKQDKLTAGEGITIDEDNVISANVGGLSIIDGFVLTDVFYSMVDSAVIDSKNIEICYNNEVFVPATTTPIIIDGEQVGYRFEGIYSSDDTLYKAYTEIKQSEIGNNIVVTVEEIETGGAGMDEDTERTIANAINAIPILKDGYAIKIENSTLNEPFRWTTKGNNGFLNITGYNNDTESSLMIGRAADITNSHSCIACGFGANISNANNSFALGSQTKTNRDSQLACGSSNIQDNTKMFIVGNGEWNVPNTAFSVGKDGNSYTEHSSIAENFVNTNNQKAVVADATGMQLKIWTGTEEEYESIWEKDNNTIYMIKEE